MNDVKFVFPGLKGNREIKANRTILAFGSDVFKTQFFGSIPERDSVPIEDSSIDTFNIFMDILYNKKVDFSKLSFKVLGDLFYLGEKYHVQDLKDAIVKNVSSRKIEANGIIEAVKVAEEKDHLVEFANSVYELCSAFVLNNHWGILELFNNVEVEEATSVSLHRMMIKAYTMKKKCVCKNCRHNPCLDGVILTKENFVADAIIKRKGDDDDIVRKTVTISMTGGEVTYRRSTGGCDVTWDSDCIQFKCY